MTLRIEEHHGSRVVPEKITSYVIYTDDDGWTDPPLSPDDPIGEIYGRTETEMLEHACLFAAAPLLLEALEKCRAYIAREDDADDIAECLEATEDALAKATGAD